MTIPDDDRVFDLPLAELDPEVSELIAGELDRQRRTLDLVASESVPPRAVLEAQGSILTAKYADGYPGRRDYDTCEWVDEIERLAIMRATTLFGADHANVQPYSGSNANVAVLHALCEPGDPVLGWDFEHGGHPTHYWSGSHAGRFYDAHSYGVRREDRLVDMDEVSELAERLRPRVVFAGWSCYPRFLDFRAFREICDGVGAFLVVDMAHFAGLVAAGHYPDPVPYADACTMTVHKTLGGARGGAILCRSELAERIDDAVYPGEQGCPLPHVTAAKAVTFAVAATEGYRDRIEATVNGARTIAAELGRRLDPSEAKVVTGGTDVHQLLVDVSGSGRGAGCLQKELNEIGISANSMRIAYDRAPDPESSGLRFGASVLASRGARDEVFVEVGAILGDAVADRSGERRGDLARRVAEVVGSLPLYGYL